MRKHLVKLWQALTRTEAGQQNLRKYHQMTTHEGWKVHQDCLLTLKGLILEELLSRRFTDLKPIEKDIRQRAYADVIEILNFLYDPFKEARTLSDISNHNRRMGATLKGATEGE